MPPLRVGIAIDLIHHESFLASFNRSLWRFVAAGGPAPMLADVSSEADAAVGLVSRASVLRSSHQFQRLYSPPCSAKKR